jgi:hypothetical protein
MLVIQEKNVARAAMANAMARILLVVQQTSMALKDTGATLLAVVTISRWAKSTRTPDSVLTNQCCKQLIVSVEKTTIVN